MAEDGMRILVVEKGTVLCVPAKPVTLDRCRFCVHSRYFEVNKTKMLSPARAYCSLYKDTNEVNLKAVTRVWCDDQEGEGFRSIMSIIS
ncbi:hypothetical protein [Methanocalculus sp. MSAO_Arc2]|uniref:hypothetical protein n=1 Tax=Methanocalculus sp. MSAO_Arc2 TaxID=2293855 RepID=UPI0026AC78CE